MDSLAIEKAAADRLARRDSGNWSAADEAELARWRDQSLAHRIALLRLQTAWQQADRLQALGAGLPADAVPSPGQWRLSTFAASAGAAAPFADVPVQMSGVEEARERLPERTAGASRRMLAVAASLVAIAMLGFGAFRLGLDTNSFQTAVGHTRAVPLADGSQVMLNTDTRIHVAISSVERRIDLERGEAFFDVAKDPARPFVVQAGKDRIVAVGTRFSVLRSREGVRVVVTEGRVRVERHTGAEREPKPTQLDAGAVARVREAAVVVTEKPVAEAEESLSWRSGYVVFRDTALADAVGEFNRYHTRKLVIGDPSIADMRIGGNLRLANLDAFVRVLEQGFPVRVVPREDEILLFPR